MRLLPAMPLLSIVFVAGWIWALFDVVYTDRGACRYVPKWLWFAIVFIFFVVGVLAWVLVGRPRRLGVDTRPQLQRRKGPTGRRGDPPPPPYLGEYDLTDRRSAELDKRLEEWERRQRDEE